MSWARYINLEVRLGKFIDNGCCSSSLDTKGVSDQHSSRVPCSIVQQSWRTVVLGDRLRPSIVESSNESGRYVLPPPRDVYRTFPWWMGWWWKRFRGNKGARGDIIRGLRGALLLVRSLVPCSVSFFLHSKDRLPDLGRVIDMDVPPRRSFRIAATVDNRWGVTIMSVGIGYVQELAIVELCNYQ